MCNDYGNRIPYSAYVDEFSQIRLPVVIPEPGRIPNLEPRDDIRPTDPAPVIRRTEGGVELARMRWGFAPGRPKAPPVINFRSEGRRFPAEKRVLVPASWFFEFTGSKYPKTKWKFTMEGEDWFCLAGLWRPGEAGEADRFTILTTAPGPDIERYHDRQLVVLRREQWAAWLDGGLPEEELLKPAPAGTLRVEQASRPKDQ